MSHTKTKTFSFIHQAGNTPSHSQESLQSLNFLINFFYSFYEVGLDELVEAYIERDLREGAGRGREPKNKLDGKQVGAQEFKLLFFSHDINIYYAR